MPLTATPNEIAAAFVATSFPDPTTEPEAYSTALKSFIDTWFLPVQSDLIEPYASTPFPPPPADWLPNVTDPAVREWAIALHTTWGTLCRTASHAVSKNPSFYSLLPVPGPFIVPGARFMEGYYWDSYWAIKGLFISGLGDLAKNVVLNLVHCVHTYGFVPNGLRSYYLNRSQPPLLAAMVEAVWESTKDRNFLNKALPALDIELTWWRKAPRSSRISVSSLRRTCLSETTPPNTTSTSLKGHQRRFLVSRYCADWRQPRPESLKEDIATVNIAMSSITNAIHEQKKEKEEQQSQRQLVDQNKLEKTREDIFCDIASAAESGWDFSSRWFEDGKSLSTIRTSKIYPADLNALLYRAEKVTATLAAAVVEEEDTTSEEKAEIEKLVEKWSSAAEERLETVNALHWDPDTHRWRDFLLVNSELEEVDNCGSGDLDDACTVHYVANKTASSSSSSSASSTAIYASDFVPLWCGCALHNSTQAALAIESLSCSGLISRGGVAASTVETGEQWDWPNAWPPLQSMLSEGCEMYGDAVGAEIAEEIARKYLKTAFAAWKSMGRMFEKFDVREVGVQGGGGEYACMDGFGWTNGLALVWLDRYGWRE
jgi:alpha,alpha-trehalase